MFVLVKGIRQGKAPCAGICWRPVKKTRPNKDDVANGSALIARSPRHVSSKWLIALGYGAGSVMVLASKVTAPIRVNALPSSVAPVFKVMDWSAKMFPLKTEVVPKVAELPTCQ